MHKFAFSHPINITEEENRILTVTSFDATNFMMKKKSSNTTPRHWTPEGGGENFSNLVKLIELRSETAFEIHVKEVEQRGTQIDIESSGCSLASFDFLKVEFFRT